MAVHGIHHVSMKCGSPENLAAVKAFYCDLLSLKVVREWPDGIMIDTGSGMIEVFSSGEGIRAQGAIRHLALNTDDVDACIGRIRRAGYPVIVEPKDIVIASDPPVYARIAFCTGPLEEQIELFHEMHPREENAARPGEVIFRRLTEEDVDAFIAIRIGQLREEGATEDFDLIPALKDYYFRHMADGTFVSWLALDGDRIIGTSGMSFVEKPPYFGCPNGRIGLLSSMYTDPAYRRRGIARQLLSRVVEEARAYGCGAVQITASDMGVLLYTNFGFVKNGNFMQLKL